MSDINLLNSDSGRSSSLAARGKRWFLRVVVVVFIASLLYYAYLFFNAWGLNKDLTESQAAIDSYQTQINQTSNRQELVTRQGQLEEANNLLAEHLSWSYLLPELARVTVQSARYTNIDAREDGELGVTVTVPNYQEADKYLQVFNLPQFNSSFSNVTVVSLLKTQEENVTETTMRLKLNFDKALLK